MFCKSLLVFPVVFLLSDSLCYGQRNKKFYREDYTYIDAVESFYKYHTETTTWFESKRVCALEGASLFYPENDNEVQAVGSFLNSTLAANNINVGISDLLVLGVYETIDGRSLSDVFHNWSSGEPNNSGGALRCVFMASGNRIFVGSCTNPRTFICKKTLQSLKWNYCCDMVDLDYSVNKVTGNCYKLHTSPLNWTDAYAACRAEQSYLAVIDNQLEADYLVNLMVSASKQRVEGTYVRGIFHVGFHNITHVGWRTVKGTPMHEDTDGWWGNNQPEGHDHCGSMFYNGRLGNVNCDTKSFFICEHEVGHSNVALLEANHYEL